MCIHKYIYRDINGDGCIIMLREVEENTGLCKIMYSNQPEFETGELYRWGGCCDENESLSATVSGWEEEVTEWSVESYTVVVEAEDEIMWRDCGGVISDYESLSAALESESFVVPEFKCREDKLLWMKSLVANNQGISDDLDGEQVSDSPKSEIMSKVKRVLSNMRKRDKEVL